MSARASLLPYLAEPLSPRQRELLRRMSEAAESEDADYDSGEIVGSGITYYLGLERISARTVKALVRHCAVKETQESQPFGLRRYRINEVGRALLRGESAKSILRRMR